MAIHNNGPQQIHDLFASKGVHIRPQECKLINYLLGGQKLHTYFDITDYLWGDDPEGGPLDTKDCIRNMTCKIRKHIKKTDLPWNIISVWGIGFRLIYTNLGIRHVCSRNSSLFDPCPDTRVQSYQRKRPNPGKFVRINERMSA